MEHKIEYIAEDREEVTIEFEQFLLSAIYDAKTSLNLVKKHYKESVRAELYEHRSRPSDINDEILSRIETNRVEVEDSATKYCTAVDRYKQFLVSHGIVLYCPDYIGAVQ